MRKSRFTLAMFALMAATGAQAQVLNEYGSTMKDGSNQCVIPSTYSADGKTYLVLVEENNDEIQLGIYNNKLSKVKTIDISEPENNRSYTVTKEREVVTKVVTNYYNSEEFTDWQYWKISEGLVSLSLDEAKSFLADSRNFSVDSTYVSADTTYLFSYDLDKYFFNEYFGRKYPIELYVYTDGKLYQRYNNWDYNENSVTLSYNSDNECDDWKHWKQDKGLMSLSLDEAKNFFANWWGNFSVDSTYVSADTTYLFSFDLSKYFYNEYFGREYPEDFYAYTDGKLYHQSKSHEVVASYTGEWKETTEYSGYSACEWPMTIRIRNYNDGVTDELYMAASQTLFNSDDAYEYIMPVMTYVTGSPYEHDRDGDGEIDYISTTYSARATAFKIISDNGNTLQTVDMPTDTYVGALGLISIDEENYIYCDAYNRNTNDGHDYYTIFYTIANGGNTRIQQVGEPIKTRVHPTVAGRNETITVELDGNGNGEKEIFVSNAAGQTVYKSKVAAGQKQVQINASGLSRGMNIISVKGNGGKADSNKVIVK